MLLTGTHQETADFKLHAFEYGKPSAEEEEDWLEIGIHLIRTKDRFHVIDPALTAAEVRMLAFWMYDIYCHKEVGKDLYFMEPCLSFHLVHSRKESKTIRVDFRCELKPAWAGDADHYSMICRFTNDELQQCAAHLLHDLEWIYKEN